MSVLEMDFMAHLHTKPDPFLVISTENEKDALKEIIKSFENASIVSASDVLTAQNDSANTVLSVLKEDKYTPELLKSILKILKPGGKLIVNKLPNLDKIKFDLTTEGFMKVEVVDGLVTALKPKFEVGSSAKLNFAKKPAAAVWKLDDTLDDDVETIDPDNLLDEDDFKKPDPTSLRVCGTTGKRKACKGCSCGLAEELAAEAKEGKIIDTKGAPKSSCGSCYLGDAFRCASCPYLGMPAFKPGEKIQLAGNQLQADV